MIAIKPLLMSCLALASASAAAVGGYYGYEYFSSIDKPEDQDKNLQDAQNSPTPNSQQREVGTPGTKNSQEAGSGAGRTEGKQNVQNQDAGASGGEGGQPGNSTSTQIVNNPSGTGAGGSSPSDGSTGTQAK